MEKDYEWVENLFQSCRTAEKLKIKINKELADLLEHSDIYGNIPVFSPQSDLLMEVIDRLRK